MQASAFIVLPSEGGIRYVSVVTFSSEAMAPCLLLLHKNAQIYVEDDGPIALFNVAEAKCLFLERAICLNHMLWFAAQADL